MNQEVSEDTHDENRSHPRFFFLLSAMSAVNDVTTFPVRSHMINVSDGTVCCLSSWTSHAWTLQLSRFRQNRLIRFLSRLGYKISKCPLPLPILKVVQPRLQRWMILWMSRTPLLGLLLCLREYADGLNGVRNIRYSDVRNKISSRRKG